MFSEVHLVLPRLVHIDSKRGRDRIMPTAVRGDEGKGKGEQATWDDVEATA